MRSNGFRRSVFALACAGLTACGGGSSGGGSDSGDGSFVTAAVTNPANGSETTLNATSTNAVLTAALAVLAATSGIEAMGIGGFDNGDEPAAPVTDDCGTGEVTTEISETGGERTFTRVFDQCYFNSAPDFLFDGRFSQVSTSVGSNIEGRLEVGQGPTAGILVLEDGSDLASIQLLSTGGALTFEGSATGSPFDVTLNNASMVVAEGDRPSDGGLYGPERGFGLLLGTDSAVTIHSVTSSANVAQTIAGTLSFRASGLNAACNLNASVGVVTATGEPILLNSAGHAVGGTLQLTGTGGTAAITFLPSGNAQITPAGGGAGTELTPAQIEALCGFY